MRALLACAVASRTCNCGCRHLAVVILLRLVCLVGPASSVLFSLCSHKCLDRCVGLAACFCLSPACSSPSGDLTLTTVCHGCCRSLYALGGAFASWYRSTNQKAQLTWDKGHRILPGLQLGGGLDHGQLGMQPGLPWLQDFCHCQSALKHNDILICMIMSLQHSTQFSVLKRSSKSLCLYAVLPESVHIPCGARGPLEDPLVVHIVYTAGLTGTSD